MRGRLISTLETNPKYIVVEAVLAEINPEQSLETITEEKEDNEASEHTKKFPLIPRFSFFLPLFTSSTSIFNIFLLASFFSSFFGGGEPQKYRASQVS